MRALLIGVGFLVAYVSVGSLLHFVVFPEPGLAPDDRPRSGTEVHLPGGSTFIFRRTALESGGAVFAAEWLGEPGAGIPRFTHPSQEVRLKVLEGSLRVVADGEERVLGPGLEVVIPAGVEHLWGNASENTARVVFELRPAGMADLVFVQLDRAFGGEAGALSTAVQTILLIGTHGKHAPWQIKALRLLIAPTARLFGYRSYYEPPASRESSLMGRRSVRVPRSNS